MSQAVRWSSVDGGWYAHASEDGRFLGDVDSEGMRFRPEDGVSLTAAELEGIAAFLRKRQECK